MAFHVWKKALGCTTFQPHWKAFFNPKAPLLAQKNDALRLRLRAALDRVKQEEAKRHADEITRMREELERQHADDLECARSAALDSINALTGSILGSA